MRRSTSAGFGLIVCASAAALPAGAQERAKTDLPDTIACPEQVAQLATCYSAKLESGAYVLSAMPNRWNGNLIVFAHGGPALAPANANTSKGDLAKYAVEVERGFAWVASAYRKEGYGVGMAGADTDD